MLNALPIILKDDVLGYFSSHITDCKTYADAIDLLKKWYTSDENNSCIIAALQTMKLTKWMAEFPPQSKVSVFRTFLEKLMELKNKLDYSYHTDVIIRGRLLTAVDLPAIQTSFRDRMPRSSQQSVQQIYIQLSDKTNFVGSNSLC